MNMRFQWRGAMAGAAGTGTWAAEASRISGASIVILWSKGARSLPGHERRVKSLRAPEPLFSRGQWISDTSVGRIVLAFGLLGCGPGRRPDNFKLVERHPARMLGIEEGETVGRCLLKLAERDPAVE